MENDPKGAYKRAPIFTGENYSYWKDCLWVHINFVGRKIWKVIENGHITITMIYKDGATIPKLEAHWEADDEKNYSYDWKAKNILISSLGVGEYFKVSHCATAKAMWDALQVSH